MKEKENFSQREKVLLQTEPAEEKFKNKGATKCIIIPEESSQKITLLDVIRADEGALIHDNDGEELYGEVSSTLFIVRVGKGSQTTMDQQQLEMTLDMLNLDSE